MREKYRLLLYTLTIVILSLVVITSISFRTKEKLSIIFLVDPYCPTLFNASVTISIEGQEKIHRNINQDRMTLDAYKGDLISISAKSENREIESSSSFYLEENRWILITGGDGYINIENSQSALTFNKPETNPQNPQTPPQNNQPPLF